MRDVTVARRYARALFELAQEDKTVADVQQALSNLRQAMLTDSAFRRTLLHPLLSAEEKNAKVRTVTSNPLVLKFTLLLARCKRMDLLTIAYDQFLAMSDEEQNIRRPVIRTAEPLSESQKRSVEESLAGSLGGKIMGRFEVSKDLIGGVWIRVGDAVLDATIKGRVEDFRRTLVHSAN